MTKEQLLAARKARAKAYTKEAGETQWGDHVLRGRRRFTVAVNHKLARKN